MKKEDLAKYRRYLETVRSRIDALDAEITKLKFGTPGV